MQYTRGYEGGGGAGDGGGDGGSGDDVGQRQAHSKLAVMTQSPGVTAVL